MIVFRVRYDVDHHCWYSAPDDWVAEHLNRLDGRSVIDGWQIPPLSREGPARPEPDLGSVNFAPDPVVAEAGRDLLATELQESVEFLPVEPSFGERWIANVMYLADCLDEERSDWRIGKTTGRRTSIARFEFRSESLLTLRAKVFRIPQLPTGTLFCTDAFRGRVQERGLTGLIFQQVWSSPDGVG